MAAGRKVTAEQERRACELYEQGIGPRRSTRLFPFNDQCNDGSPLPAALDCRDIGAAFAVTDSAGKSWRG
jgi:hypothetical protein